jgi:hypothetical protein
MGPIHHVFLWIRPLYILLHKESVPRDIRFQLQTTVSPKSNVSLILDYLENRGVIGGSLFVTGKWYARTQSFIYQFSWWWYLPLAVMIP